MTDDSESEKKLPHTLYIDGFPYTTEEQLLRRRERLADLGLPDDLDTATTQKPEKPNILSITPTERGDITG
jgi:hypothetical protein